MKRPAVMLSLTLLCLSSAPASAQTESDAISQGIYTAAQAERGREHYMASCSSCHSADLRGNSNAPSLRGVSFSFIWEGRPLAELYSLMQEQMPTDRPGSLSPAAYAEILAFILSSNGYPDGKLELSADPQNLAEIIITPITAGLP